MKQITPDWLAQLAAEGRLRLGHAPGYSEPQCLTNEEAMLLLAMKADTDAGQRVRAEMIQIIIAWQRNHLLPRVEAPILQTLYGKALGDASQT